MIINQGPDKARRGPVQYQPPLEPPKLLRLGHVGLFVRDFKACDAWYRKVLGLLPSDLMYAGEPANTIAGFFRINRGSEWVDHHTVALFGFGKSDLHHISFEVQNAEAQFIAHRWLAGKGHKTVWGVGRHPKGSHVFDVWREPSGYRFETYSDTDLCTADKPPGVFDITTMEMDLWSDRSHEAYFE
jgi:catechol 2,3-dioxygenase-like lactoylglutathione lyase family enzyme